MEENYLSIDEDGLAVHLDALSRHNLRYYPQQRYWMRVRPSNGKVHRSQVALEAGVSEDTLEEWEKAARKAKGCYKTEVIEEIFRNLWNDDRRILERAEVTSKEVIHYVNAYNKTHGTEHARNAANVIKDFVRKVAFGNKHWPRYVADRGYALEQVTGEGKSFKFVPIPEGQQTPFILDPKLEPPDKSEAIDIESVSLPLTSRRLGRKDESWLSQVIVHLRLVEHYFACHSRNNVLSVSHLQMNVKVGKSEIDSLYLVALKGKHGDDDEAIVALEAKREDDILKSQIASGVEALYKKKGMSRYKVVPMAAKITGKSLIQLVEFGILSKDDDIRTESLEVVGNRLYRLRPSVEGIV